MNIGQKKVISIFSFILGGLLLCFFLGNNGAYSDDPGSIRLFLGIIFIGLGLFMRKGMKRNEGERDNDKDIPKKRETHYLKTVGKVCLMVAGSLFTLWVIFGVINGEPRAISAAGAMIMGVVWWFIFLRRSRRRTR